MSSNKTPEIILIVAHSKNRVIGKNNKIPWHLPSDLKHFQKTTLGNVILMGRKTWDSLPVKPLSRRMSVVLSRDEDFWETGLYGAYQSAYEAIFGLKDFEKIFVIGGEEIYKTFLPQAHRVIATQINAEFEGDAFFPEMDANDWDVVSRSQPQEENGLSFEYVEYVRRGAVPHQW